MVACAECGVTVSRSSPDILACLRCSCLVHLACANVNISKKNFERLRKGQTDFFCVKCRPRGAGGDTSPPANSNLKSDGGNTRSLSEPASPLAAATLPPGYAEAIQAAVAQGQKSAFTQAQEHFSKMFKTFEQTQLRFQAELSKSVSEMKQDITENARRIDQLEVNSELHEMKLVDAKKEADVLKSRIATLEDALNSQAQATLGSTLEVHGLPCKPNEDLVAVVKSIGAALDVAVSEDDIEKVYRIRKGPVANSRYEPTMVVKLCRSALRDKMIEKRKALRDFSTVNIGWDTSDKHPIFIRESLTPENRRIYSLALGLRREHKIKYLWIAGGKIFCRKEDGSSRIHLSNLRDIEGIK